MWMGVDRLFTIRELVGYSLRVQSKIELRSPIQTSLKIGREVRGLIWSDRYGWYLIGYILTEILS
jgi:hypothetical protein